MLLLAGCASTPSHSFPRPFAFQHDTFAFANELVWEYEFDDASGKTGHRKRVPPPEYTHHCFVVVRAAKQFFQNARFDPEKPRADESTYRRLVQQVVALSPRKVLPESKRVVIPGYTNLFAFSRDCEHVLKDECGGAWRSYFQQGHWRMIFPFPRAHQGRTARQLLASLERNRPAIVHLVRFPSLKINHSVLVFDVSKGDTETRFSVYDPNHPEKPSQLTYDHARRTFHLPRNPYFSGGRVEVYEIYHAWNY